MAVAHEYRIPHSEFLRWDEDDREKAIGFHVRQLTLCPLCGLPPEDHPDRRTSRALHRFEVKTNECPWAGEIERARKRNEKAPNAGSLYYSLAPREIRPELKEVMTGAKP